MKYALLLNLDEDVQGALDAPAYKSLLERLLTEGKLAGSRRLAPAADAVTVRTASEANQREPGPATPAPISAFLVVEVQTEAEALALAADVADATGANVEVRPTAPPGEGSSDLAGVGARSTEGKEFVFVINVAEADRPWPGDPAFEGMMERCGRVLATLESRGAFRGTERLAPAKKAKTVRAAAQGRRVIDGPFAEARELIGGFILGACADLDEAVSLAALIPGASSGSVEVRETLPE